MKAGGAYEFDYVIRGTPEWRNDGSRMSREAHVRFCEGLGVKLPRPTHAFRKSRVVETDAWMHAGGLHPHISFTCDSEKMPDVLRVLLPEGARNGSPPRQWRDDVAPMICSPGGTTDTGS